VCLAFCLGTLAVADWTSLIKVPGWWATSARQSVVTALALNQTITTPERFRNSSATFLGSEYAANLEVIPPPPPGTATEKVSKSTVCQASKAFEFATGPSCGQHDIHTFDNGVSICKMGDQLKRYSIENLHEPDESKAFYSLLKRAPHGATFLDVGAAIGYYSLWGVKIQPSLVVYGFNPSEMFRRQFAEHQLLNFGRDHLDQICQDQHCAGGSDGITIHIGNEFGDQIGANPKKPGNNCTTITYSSWMQKRGLERPYLVMVDIQGVEKDFVPSILSSHLMPDLLIIGTHSSKIHDALLAEVGQKGYDILWSAGWGKQTLAPDGSIVAARTNWSRREEFQALAQHFTRENLGLAFAQYLATDSSWYSP